MGHPWSWVTSCFWFSGNSEFDLEFDHCSSLYLCLCEAIHWRNYSHITRRNNKNGTIRKNYSVRVGKRCRSMGDWWHLYYLEMTFQFHVQPPELTHIWSNLQSIKQSNSVLSYLHSLALISTGIKNWSNLKDLTIPSLLRSFEKKDHSLRVW